MTVPWDWILAWVLAASLLAAVLTAVDKRRARLDRWRIAESTLWLIAAAGGAAAMLVTMRCIRHKTRHRRFMWGLPLLIVLQAALLLLLAVK